MEAPSHYVRKHSYVEKSRPKVLNTLQERRSIQEVVDNGVVVKKAVIVTEDPTEKFRGLKTTDFALENLIAVGAVNGLRDCSLSYATSGETADSIDANVASLESAITADLAAHAENETVNE